MYMDQMVSVGKASNGFIVEATVSFKNDAKNTDKMTACCCGSSSSGCEKQYLAKDVNEVLDLINDIMPLLSQDFKDENEFDKAFDAAAKDMEGADDGKKESSGSST